MNRFSRNTFNSNDDSLISTDLELPAVTMVISAYNEQDVISDKILNCMAIDYPEDRIKFIIGSDGCDDRTNEILQKLTDTRFHVVLIPQRRGKVRMLNLLMGLVHSDLVVFSDANTMYASDSIRKLVSKFNDEKVGCVIGHLELSAQTTDADACKPEGMYWRYENKIKQLESDLGAVPTVNGGIFAIRRELYNVLPEHAVTEDQVLGMKIMTQGYRCVFADDARAHEDVADWKGELRRRIRISAGNFQSLFLVPQILNPRCGRVSFAFYSHKLLRWMVPFFLIGMLMANILLVGKAFYGSTMILQTIFYGSGLISTVTPKLTGVLKLLAIPKYFISMNFAILIGFMRFVMKRQHVTWAKTRNIN
ncbi:MAG: glycosyltransferase family 2 protein [Phycisphaerae bacterium]|nr:glycosyltransferase family 2 protein [Phycisphaerae bacterium]